jgi:hypothetical protein
MVSWLTPVVDFGILSWCHFCCQHQKPHPFEYSKLRDELLDREVFDTLWDVQVLTEQW